MAMSAAQFEVLKILSTSGFKSVVWGSDETGWRIGPVYRVATRTKYSIERQGWIRLARGGSSEGTTLEWIEVTEARRRAHISAGGNPGEAGYTRKKKGRLRGGAAARRSSPLPLRCGRR